MNHPGAREVLRQATQDAHLCMHSLAPFVAIANGQLTIAGYRRLLGSLFLFHSAIAMAAERHGYGDLSSSYRRLELLISDISYLGEAVPRSLPTWDPGRTKATLGAIYVAEGSAIGGKFIAQQLDYLLEGSDGRTFFSGGGTAGPRGWSQLVAILEERLRSGEAQRTAITGALAAFDLFEKCVGLPIEAGLATATGLRPPPVPQAIGRQHQLDTGSFLECAPLAGSNPEATLGPVCLT